LWIGGSSATNQNGRKERRKNNSDWRMLKQEPMERRELEQPVHSLVEETAMWCG
jgi:hypothetical protein